MRKIKKEKVLLYNFNEAEKLKQAQDFFSSLHITIIVVKKDDFLQRVGYLLGLAGFAETLRADDENFDFSSQVMIFHNIKQKRLDEVLQKLRKAQISTPYKAVVTPLNRFWSLKRLCQTMYKEHGYFIEQEKKQAENG